MSEMGWASFPSASNMLEPDLFSNEQNGYAMHLLGRDRSVCPVETQNSKDTISQRFRTN